MIRLTKSGNGEPVYVSPDLIVSSEIVDEVTMLNVRSDRIFVTESPEEVVRKVLEWQTAYRKNDIDTLYQLAGLKTPWEEKADKVIDGLIEKLGLEEQA